LAWAGAGARRRRRRGGVCRNDARLEMARDGSRWPEMARDGSRWLEIGSRSARDGSRSARDRSRSLEIGSRWLEIGQPTLGSSGCRPDATTGVGTCTAPGCPGAQPIQKKTARNRASTREAPALLRAVRSRRWAGGGGVVASARMTARPGAGARRRPSSRRRAASWMDARMQLASGIMPHAACGIPACCLRSARAQARGAGRARAKGCEASLIREETDSCLGYGCLPFTNTRLPVPQPVIQSPT
jgi:hypothetical protein